MNVKAPFHLSMKGNIWIHLSSLALCFAIGYRAWEYKHETVHKKRIDHIKKVISDDLMETYDFLISRLLHENVDLKIPKGDSDRLAIVRYLYDNDDEIGLRDLYLRYNLSNSYASKYGTYESYDGVRYSEVEVVSVFDKISRKNYYAVGLLRKLYRSKSSAKLDALQIDANVIDLKNCNDGIYGINLKLFWDLIQEQELEYSIDGVVQPMLNGGAATSDIPLNIDVKMTSEITGESKVYKFNKIKA